MKSKIFLKSKNKLGKKGIIMPIYRNFGADLNEWRYKPMYTTEELSRILQCRAELKEDRNVSEFAVDSRLLNSPEDTVFFALKGNNHDGHQYIRQLYDKGVRTFVVSEERPEYASMPDADFFHCTSAMDALRTLAAYHRSRINSPVIGITGSNGKTIVKEWLAQMISGDMKLSRSPRSYNSQVGVPLSLLAADPESDLCIIEAGISMPGEMSMHQKLVRPDVGIFTHLGDAHGENFQSQKQKFYEKAGLFSDSRIVICQEGEQADYFRLNMPSSSVLFTWSLKSDKRASLALLSRKPEQSGDISGTRLVLEYRPVEENPLTGLVSSGSGPMTMDLFLPFSDDASVENIMSVLSCLLLMGYGQDVISKRISELQPVGMRMEIKAGVNNSVLINDYYNSDLSSLSLAMNTLASQDASREKVLILSDFVDVSSDLRHLYSEVARMMGNLGINELIGIGENIGRFRDVFDRVPVTRFYPDTNAFLKLESRTNFRDRVVLIKGARKFRFENISEFLTRQSHSTVLEVDLDAMASNLSYFRSKLPSGTKMAVMVKASSYGSGAVEVASMLQYNGVDYLMVAFADEGVELRRAGITVPVGVMNPEPDSFDNMIEFSLEPEIYSMELLEEFERAVSKYGITDYPVHIKLNTGMNRSGLDEPDLDSLERFFSRRRNVVIRSAFSHLATSDMPSEDEFTLSQIHLFERMSSRVQNIAGHKIIRHILNSAGIERFPQYAFDMVRLGVGLHGISFAGAELRHVSSFKSYIASLRHVHPGDTVGYGRKGRITSDSVIAVVLVGYADGLDRHLSAGVGEMFVRGKRVPIVGNICMDACMIDVTGTGAEVGDEVEIFGDNIPVTELSDKLGTIPYEIFTSIAPRVRRVYYKE